MQLFRLLPGVLLCFITASTASLYSQAKEISFDDALRFRIFSAKSAPRVQFPHLEEGYLTHDGRSILRHSWRDGSAIDTLFRVEWLEHDGPTYLAKFSIDNEDKRILLEINPERIYRHSYRADYYLYDRGSGTFRKINQADKIQLCTLSPDAGKVAYVFENNLYYVDLKTGEEVQVTADGKQDHIINGAPDWVYEEEFAFSRGFTWSPDSRSLAFYRTNESRVKTYKLTRYDGAVYPEWVSYKYPKAGEQNALVSIHVHHLETGKTVEMDSGEETDQYIPRIWWTGRKNELAIIRLNRLQNHLDLMFANTLSGESKVVLSDQNERYIIEPTDHTIVFTTQGFLYLNERSGFLHYYHFSWEGKLIRPVTSGRGEVIDFLGYDRRSNSLYYSAYDGNSTRSAVFRTSLEKVRPRKISKKSGWNTAVFSPDFRHYFLTHSSAGSPPRTTLHAPGGNIVTIEDNAFLKKVVKQYKLPEKELFEIETAEGTRMNAYMYKPKDFDPEKQYPVLMHVYGGPNSQEVRDEWGTDPWHYLLLEQGYLIVCVDNRGTGGKGADFRKSTYLCLLELEVEDQVTAAKYLGSLDYIDAGRIGIWGSSYGGSMAAMCILRGANVFKLAIALYPVTDWKFYDTIYTERYMRTPEDNPEGYRITSVMEYADRLKGSFLLVHGMSDDNVHLQHSVALVEALVRQGKQFEMAFYPDHSHGIHYRNAAMQLAAKKHRFVKDHL